MMTDRFDAQLRQHLVETADERPAGGQFDAIVAGVAATPQRRPLLGWVPEVQVRIGGFPAVVRYGLIALALVLAAVAGAIIAGGGPPPPSTPFEGRWTATDPGDASTLTLDVGRGPAPRVRFVDDQSSGGVCDLDAVKVFMAVGTGQISDSRLVATYPEGGGCGSSTVPMGGRYDYDADTDTLTDQNGVIWTRVRGVDGLIPTFPPAPTPNPAFEGRWTATDPSDGSTMTLVVAAGSTPIVQFQDDLSTGGACVADAVKVFRADGTGEVIGNRLFAHYPDGGGCGLQFVEIGGEYEYQAGSDTMFDIEGLTWSRVSLSADPPPTLRPAPSPKPGQTFTDVCFDIGQGGTYTAPASLASILVTATVPASLATPWHGWRDEFALVGACEDSVNPMGFWVSAATTLNDGGCLPSRAEIADLADAIARLDTPQGNDISDRIDLTIHGHPAARYDISNLATCPEFGLWDGTMLGAGETGSIYVIDVDGVLLEIEFNRNGRQTPAELEEAHAIIAGLQFTQ